MLIHNASQLLTLAGGPQFGLEIGRLGIISNGAVLIEGERIAAVGPSEALRAAYPDAPTLDAAGKVVMPGFVDAHTHAIWVGDRVDEFEQLAGSQEYRKLEAAGQGILTTVSNSCAASLERLLQETRLRLWSMFNYGTTTAEVKTGYGLRTSTELRMLQALLALDAEGPLELAITFMGAHAVPADYEGQSDAYTDLLCSTMLPILEEWWPHHAPYHPLPFVDVYCEPGAFNLDQSRRILSTARKMGFPLKVHAECFSQLGGARLAVEMGAVSADHLVHATPEDLSALAASGTAAVALPCISFGLADCRYLPTQNFLTAGGLLALGTGLNPGTAWCENMQFAIALACRFMQLTPAQAIAAATINSATAIDRAERLGSLEVGKQADLLILSVPDYRHLGYRFGGSLVQTVIKKGRVYPV